MQIRPYLESDSEFVLELFDRNTPSFFSPDERGDLIFYLENEIENYFVLEVEDIIVACGGYNKGTLPSEMRISWDLVHPDYQGKGYGSALLKYRIQKIQEDKTINLISVRTSQLAYKYYEKNHFVLNEVVHHYWAEGFDLYSMVLEKLD